MANKITKKDMFKMIMEVAEVKANQSMVDFIQHEIDLIDNKAKNKKATKTQEQNVGIKAIILEVLEGAEPMTITEMQNANEELGALSNQKVSALVRQLCDTNEVVKVVDKKTSRFVLPMNE